MLTTSNAGGTVPPSSGGAWVHVRGLLRPPRANGTPLAWRAARYTIWTLVGHASQQRSSHHAPRLPASAPGRRRHLDLREKKKELEMRIERVRDENKEIDGE
jgi:hypothetical protein